MGVGRPEDIIEGIARGVDLFDCVMPTRNGRNRPGVYRPAARSAFVTAKYERELRPIDETCPCPACRHSLGYIRHLFMAKEMLGPILVSAHNVTYYERLVAETRKAIMEGNFAEFRKKRLEGWAEEEPL